MIKVVYGENEWSNYDSSVRPSISLVSGLEYNRGNGSTTNPYVVDLNSLGN